MAKKRKPRVVRWEGGPIPLDENLQGADWPKRTWDLPPPSTGSGELKRPAFPELKPGETRRR